MDRFVIFVDAGYLLAEGGKLACGTSTRSDIYLDFGKVTAALEKLCAEHCGLPHLRTYWYDGWWDGNPNPAHIKLSYEKGVKLRLGRLTRWGQKGVDSRIVRDLIVLSHNRSMAAAYLLGGDEDLSEGVETAQEWGVPVVVIGVETVQAGRQNLSDRLVRAADELLILSGDDVSEFMWLREERDVVGPEEGEEFGRKYAARWLQKVDEDLVAAAIAQRPRIPRSVDARLMEAGEETLGPSLQHDQELRHAVRAGFWAVVSEDRPDQRSR